LYYSTREKETREVLEEMFDKINYNKFQWLFSGDLKIIGIVCGIQSQGANHPCFLCDWKKPPNRSKTIDPSQRSSKRARAENEFESTWPEYKGENRTSWMPRQDKNIVNRSLVPIAKMLIPPLHVKIGVMTQLTKVLVQNERALEFIKKTFPRLSDAKILNGVFCGPDIRTLMKSTEFPNILTTPERDAWEAFRDCIENFFGNHRSVNSKQMVQRLMHTMKVLKCRMTVKLHFLDAHFDYFPECLGQFSEEQGERFHQELKRFETRYQDEHVGNILSDYCWCLVRETDFPLNNKHRHFKVKYFD
jgi:hypothetical protein